MTVHEWQRFFDEEVTKPLSSARLRAARILASIGPDEEPTRKMLRAEIDAAIARGEGGK